MPTYQICPHTNETCVTDVLCRTTCHARMSAVMAPPVLLPTGREILHAQLEKLLIKWESVAADTNWNGHIRSGYEACAKDVRKLLATFPI